LEQIKLLKTQNLTKKEIKKLISKRYFKNMIEYIFYTSDDGDKYSLLPYIQQGSFFDLSGE